jgi:hypothetical protein
MAEEWARSIRLARWGAGGVVRASADLTLQPRQRKIAWRRNEKR